MELSSQAYEHDRLQNMSFTEVFRDFAELARRTWEQKQMESLIVRRALRCYRQRLQRPDYAAVFLCDSREDSECDTAG